MYLADLHGKMPSKIDEWEDILTSNVFSFFKYCRRDVFLKGYLSKLGFNLSVKEAEDATFIFWPRFEDNTEPDLVIIAGDYYFLVEAKYYSDFSQGTPETRAQLQREIEGGEYEANNLNIKFKLIAITKDHYYEKDKFVIIPHHMREHFKWTNWQTVSFFLYDTLSTNDSLNIQERDFAKDLYDLLDKRNLRNYLGIRNVFKYTLSLSEYSSIFFKAATAKFRGDFIGFHSALQTNGNLVLAGKKNLSER